MNFTKMHGLGNDFMVIDNSKNTIKLNTKQIKKLANRNFGIGFDQLLMVEKSFKQGVDFKYLIYNANGLQVEQCGNGARCFARFVLAKKLTNKKLITVETNAGIITLKINENKTVDVNMGQPDFNSKSIIKYAKNQEIYKIENYELGLVSMGNPHAILQVKNITEDIKQIGIKIQNNNSFISGVNVSFMQIINRNNIKLRVFERGVGETLACGSGACAAVSFGIRQKLLDNKVLVNLRGGDCIVKKIKNDIILTGPAEFVFEGKIFNF